ncbi:MAG: hypothetical protein GKR89_02970 [Candidatus Latescibacteria bacterium]|nr:hypothetical protein [Candidatus Latescibacterota bacterium]
MRLSIVSFQKNRNAHLEAVEAEYIKRLRPHAQIDLHPVKRWDDQTTLPAALAKAHRRIGLFLDGKAWDSAGLARRLDQLRQGGASHLLLAIGAHEGMPAAVAAHMQERWSLSNLTFSHQLARLLLLEALYRSFDILHGGRYHK